MKFHAIFRLWNPYCVCRKIFEWINPPKVESRSNAFPALKHNRLMIWSTLKISFGVLFYIFSNINAEIRPSFRWEPPICPSPQFPSLKTTKKICIIIKNSHFAKSFHSIRKSLAYDESSRCLIGRGNNRVIIGSFLSREDKEWLTHSSKVEE